MVASSDDDRVDIVESTLNARDGIAIDERGGKAKCGGGSTTATGLAANNAAASAPRTTSGEGDTTRDELRDRMPIEAEAAGDGFREEPSDATMDVGVGAGIYR